MKFTVEELNIREREASEKKAAAAAAEAEAKKAEIVAWLATAPKVDTIVVSSALAVTSDDDTDFNTAIIDLIVKKSDNLSVGFFLGSMIMRDKLNNLIQLCGLIETLKKGGMNSSTVIDALVEGIKRFC